MNRLWFAELYGSGNWIAGPRCNFRGKCSDRNAGGGEDATPGVRPSGWEGASVGGHLSRGLREGRQRGRGDAPRESSPGREDTCKGPGVGERGCLRRRQEASAPLWTGEEATSHRQEWGRVTAPSPRLLAPRGQAGRDRLSPQLQALSAPEAGVWAAAVPAEAEQRR